MSSSSRDLRVGVSNHPSQMPVSCQKEQMLLTVKVIFLSCFNRITSWWYYYCTENIVFNRGKCNIHAYLPNSGNEQWPSLHFMARIVFYRPAFSPLYRLFGKKVDLWDIDLYRSEISGFIFDVNPILGGRVVQFCTTLGSFTHRKYFLKASICCDI